MTKFLKYLEEHIIGFLVLILLGFSLVLIVKWIAKIFRLGQYKNAGNEPIIKNDIEYVVTQFFVNLINDFRHLLALIIVFIFSVLIIYAMASANDFLNKMEALESVVTALGGLIGSIIGYYFGESAAKGKSGESGSSPGGPNPTPSPTEEIDPIPEIQIE